MRRREDAHREALRAAARLAFSAAVLGGCSPSTPAPVSTQATIGSAPPSVAPPPDTATPAPEPSASQAPLDPAACDALVAKTFPETFTRVDPKTAPNGLVGCCEERALLRYDPNCCNFLYSSGAIKWDQNDDDRHADDRQHRIMRSCSPWGPPMPPSTHARRSHRIARRRAPRKTARTLSLREEARRYAPPVPVLPGLREAAIDTWRARMVNEHGSARVFEGLARQAARAGLAADLRRELAGFADEERRHGILCGAVVEALGGEAHAEIDNPPPYPRHRDAANALEAFLRDVISVCCLSETVAVALIGAERLEMPDGPLRDLLTQIYADEVGHARFGWQLLEKLAPTLDGATKEALGEYLITALAHLEEHELAHLPVSSNPPPEGRAYGLCNGRDARALFYDTVASVIVPGLERHGIKPARPIAV